MKYIKTFKNINKINEEFGGLELVALTIGAMTALPALLNYANGLWQKFLMEKKYIPTGKVEKCELVDRQKEVGGQEGEKKYLEFQELKDKESGEMFYGTEMREGAGPGTGDENKNVMFILYSKENFEKIREELKKEGAEYVLTKYTAKKMYSKTPGSDGYGSSGGNF